MSNDLIPVPGSPVSTSTPQNLAVRGLAAILQTRSNASALVPIVRTRFQQLKWEAEQGHANAQTLLGIIYSASYNCWLCGINEYPANDTCIDIEHHFYQEWKDLVDWYEVKEGEEYFEDFINPALWLEKAAQQGHDRAQLWLGDYYYNCRYRGFRHDKNKSLATAMLFYEKSVEQGNSVACFRLFQLHFELALKDRDEAFSCESAPKWGTPEYQVILSKVNEPALSWLKKSAELGLGEAQARLAEHEGTYDQEREIYWLKKSAEQGYYMSQYRLCEMFLAQKDEIAAMHWFKMALSNKAIFSQPFDTYPDCAVAATQNIYLKVYVAEYYSSKDPALSAHWFRAALADPAFDPAEAVGCWKGLLSNVHSSEEERIVFRNNLIWSGHTP